MNGKLKPLIVIVLGLAIAYQLYVYFKPESVKQEVPAISLALVDGKNVSLPELAKEKHLVAFIVRSDCDFCKKQMESFRKNIDRFRNTEILFISFEEMPVIRKMNRRFFSVDIPYMNFAQARQEELAPFLEKELVFPYMLWYDKKGRQKAQYKGLFPVDRIIEVIELTN